MISALNLLWIVPLSGLLGVLILSLLFYDPEVEGKENTNDEQKNCDIGKYTKDSAQRLDEQPEKGRTKED